MAKVECCHNCVYSYFDGGLWLRTLWSGFPLAEMCANHPETLGHLREVRGGICRNYREKPAEPSKHAKRILLTEGIYTYVDAGDYEELCRYQWRLVGGGYAGRSEKGKTILMHRQIMQPPPGMVVDHGNRNKLDNTRDNLRVCTRAENARNKAKHRGARSRYKGVYFDRTSGRWFAAICYQDRLIRLGYFDNEPDAARAYDRRAVELFGEFAWLNFPDEWPPEKRAEVHVRRTQPG